MKAAVFATVAALVASTPLAPPEITLRAFTYGGSGCPNSSPVSVSFSEDKSSVTVLAGTLYAAATSDITESRSNCQVNVDLGYPAGWRYAVASAAFKGQVDLPSNASGTAKVITYFSGQANQATAASNFAGPVSRSFENSVYIGIPNLIWSSCGPSASLNINTQVRVSTVTQGASISLGSEDSNSTATFGLYWQRC
ncbi:hypothetical protein HDU91_005080 [Kappamyces sp. JEL0680]|nr:hypothetical protein HDU91_005080 [Kappamyces sp. JEL0680]